MSKRSISYWLNGKYIEQKKYKKTKKINYSIIEFIKNYVLGKTLFIMSKLLNKINKKFNVQLSKSYVYNILKINNITHKKINIKKNIKKTNNKGKITKWLNDIKNENKNMIILLDESSIVVNDYPRYGWSKKGDKAIIKTNKKNTVIKKHLIMT